MASDFLSTYTPLANDIATQTGLDPSVVLGIIDTETGGGQHVKSNNIFGISPSGPQGQYVAGYPDVQTAAQAFVNLMQTPRYQGVAAAGDPAAQSAALVKAGYNTANPNYASIVANKATNFGKQLGYQDGQPQPANSAPAPDYNTPASTAPTPKPTSAKDAANTELSGSGGGTSPPPAPTPGSAKDAANTELSQPVPPGAVTGAPQAVPKPDAGPVPPAQSPAAVPTQGYFGPDGSYVPPQAVPSPNQATDYYAPPPPKPDTLPGATEAAAADRILQAAKEGWQGSPSILTPQGRAAVDQSGVLGRYVYNPLLDIAGGILGAGAAGLRGGQQFVSEALSPISPQLGRDIAALPEAFPTGVDMPRAPSTVGQARNALGQGVQASDLTDAIRRADEAAAADRVAGAPPADRAAASSGQPPPAGGAAPGATGLGNLGQMAGAIGANLRDMLWDKLQRGDTTELGKPSQILIDAKAAMDDGTIKSRSDFDAWTQQWGAQRRAQRQQQAGEAPEERSTPSPGPVPEEDHVAAGEAPQPQSVGAAASRQGTPGADIADQSNLERARNLRTDIDQSARDRAGPALKDDTAYVTDVPGGTLPERMTPERDFSPQTALDHKRRYESSEGQAYRAAYDANTTQRNQGMVDLLRQDAGDALTLDQARTARRDVAPDAFGAFDGEKAVPQGTAKYVENIQDILSSPAGKRGAVERTLNGVLSRMYDADGNLETMPSQLYGVKQHIDDLLNKAQRPLDAEGNDAAVAQSILRGLKDRTDNLIQSGAQNYGAYREAYRQYSQPVNQQRFLQRFQQGTNKLTNAAGDLQLNKLNAMLEAIHQGLTDRKFNLAQSLTDQQIQNVVNVRNELAAKQLTDIQSRTRGSDSYQKINAAAEAGQGALGRAVRAGAEMAAHGGLGYLATHGVPMAGGVNALLAFDRMYGRPARMARSAAKQQAAATAQKNALDARLLSQQPTNPLGMY